MITRFLQYNYNDKNFEYTYKIDVFGFDPSLSFFANLNLTKTKYTISNGFLVL